MTPYQYTLPNGVILFKWQHKLAPTEEQMRDELEKLGFKAYDLQTCAPWFERSLHAHDYEEIRAAVSGTITFHFKKDNLPLTLEAGDVVVIPAGLPHEVISHNSQPFTAFKGSRLGLRKVTEHGDGKGSVEDLAAQR